MKTQISTPKSLNQLIQSTRHAMENRVPATPNQSTLWLLEKINGEHSSVINSKFLFRITQELDLNHLTESLVATIEQHEALYTSVRFEQETLWQVKNATSHIHEAIISCHASSFDEAVSIVDSHYRQGLPSSSQVLIRCILVSFGDGDCVLGIVVNHIAFDGWSYGLFLDELEARYNREAKVGASAPGYLSYARQLARAPDSEELAQARVYWQEVLSNFSDSGEVADLDEDVSGRIKRYPICDGDMHSLARFSKSVRVSLPALFLASVYAWLTVRESKRDVIIGVPLSNRPESYEDTIGCFVNVVPVRLNAGGTLTNRDLVACAQTKLLESLEHGQIPYSTILGDYRSCADDQFSKLYEVSFSSHVGFKKALSLEGCNTQVMPPECVKAPDKIAFYLEQSDECSLSIAYQTAGFCENEIDAIFETILAIAKGIASHPESEALTDISSQKPTSTKQVDARNAKQASGPLHEIVKTAWGNVLGDYREDAHFFQNGGDSIKAVVVTKAIASEIAIHLPIGLIFKARNISEYIAEVRAIVQTAGSPC